MNSRLIRLLLVGIGVLIGVVATYFLNDLDTRINTQRSSIETLRDQAKALSASIADVRAGQVAYVARGQGEAFWMSHVDSLLPALQKHTTEFGSSLTVPWQHRPRSRRLRARSRTSGRSTTGSRSSSPTEMRCWLLI